MKTFETQWNVARTLSKSAFSNPTSGILRQSARHRLVLREPPSDHGNSRSASAPYTRVDAAHQPQRPEGIVADRSSEHVQAVHRSRFYPHQWQLTLKPLLESLASQRHVRLTWTGWDRSLPRLYLDASHLSRAVLNLVSNAIYGSRPGAEVSIRIDWQATIAQGLIIAIEDQCGFDEDLMRKMNSSAAWRPLPGDFRGTGLKIAKSLIVAMGGSISVQEASSGSARIRVVLPIDDYHLLVRHWLSQNAQRAIATAEPQRASISIHAIRCGAVDAHLVDAQLQLAVERDMIYRVAKDRWLWISMSATGMNEEGNASALRRAVGRLCELDYARGARPLYRVQRVLRLKDLSLVELQSSSDPSGRLATVSGALAQKIAELIGTRVPPIDGLEASPSIGVCTSMPADSLRVRQDHAQVVRPHTSSRNNVPVYKSPAGKSL